MILNNRGGEVYKESGKFDPKGALIGGLISLILSGLLGVGYGFLSHINPLIYLNFVLLGISVLGLVLITGFAISKSRNQFVTFAIIFICSLFFLYNAWAGVIGSGYRFSMWDGFTFSLSINDITDFMSHQSMSVSKMGRSSGLDMGPGLMAIFYLIEAFIVLIAPAYLVMKESSYFCEECVSPYTNMDFFIETTQKEVIQNESGSLILGDSPKFILPNQFSALGVKTKLTKLNTHICLTCKSAIIDIDEGIIKQDKNSFEFSRTDVIVRGIYLDDKSKNIFFKE